MAKFFGDANGMLSIYVFPLLIKRFCSGRFLFNRIGLIWGILSLIQIIKRGKKDQNQWYFQPKTVLDNVGLEILLILPFLQEIRRKPAAAATDHRVCTQFCFINFQFFTEDDEDDDQGEKEILFRLKKYVNFGE